MNWNVWGPIVGALVTGILALVGIVVRARKDHHAAMEQVDVAKDQAAAAMKQAEAALESARAAARTAETTAQATTNDTFTRAYAAASKNWAEWNEAQQKWNEGLQKQISDNAARIDEAEMRAEADRQARDEAEKKFRIAVAWMRRCIRWIDENLPGSKYPPLPPEIDLDLDL
jgi:hypothetical protein